MSIPKTAPDPAVNTPDGVPDAGDPRQTYENDMAIQRDDRRIAEQLAKDVLPRGVEPVQPDRGPGARDRKAGA